MLEEISPLFWLDADDERVDTSSIAYQDWWQVFDDPVLAQLLRWSNAVNTAVEDMVSSLPPFPLVRER